MQFISVSFPEIDNFQDALISKVGNISVRTTDPQNNNIELTGLVSAEDLGNSFNDFWKQPDIYGQMQLCTWQLVGQPPLVIEYDGVKVTAVPFDTVMVTDMSKTDGDRAYPKGVPRPRLPR